MLRPELTLGYLTVSTSTTSCCRSFMVRRLAALSVATASFWILQTIPQRPRLTHGSGPRRPAAPLCALGTPYLLSTGVVLVGLVGPVGHKKAAVEGAGPISSGPRRGRRGVRAGAGLEGESVLVTSRAC